MEDRLQKFARLVECGSFTEAARALHISQPALSTAIQKLERELQAPLLDRHSQGIRPTAAGRAAYQAAKRFCTLGQNLRNQTAQLNQEAPPLKVGMIDSIASLLFASGTTVQAVLDYTNQPTFEVHNSRYLCNAVLQADLTMAITAEQDDLAAHLVQQRLETEPLLAVCHPKRAAHFRTELLAGRLSDYLGYDHYSHTHRLIAQTCARYNIAIQPLLQSTSPEAMHQLVLQAQGVAILPYALVEHDIATGSLIRLGLGKSGYIGRPISVVFAREYQPNKADTLILRHIRQTLHDQRFDLKKQAIYI